MYVCSTQLLSIPIHETILITAQYTLHKMHSAKNKANASSIHDLLCLSDAEMTKLSLRFIP